MFDHEKLDVYNAGIQFVVVSNEVIENLPRGKNYLADQLARAASSIPLNIAEGAGEFSYLEKCRFYRMAKRSATECAAILDVCKKILVIDERKYIEGRELLFRIVSMLIKMAKFNENPGTGTGTHTGTNEKFNQMLL